MWIVPTQQTFIHITVYVCSKCTVRGIRRRNVIIFDGKRRDWTPKNGKNDAMNIFDVE